MSISSSSTATQSGHPAEFARLLREADPRTALLPQLQSRGFVATPESSVDFDASAAQPTVDLTGAVAHIDPRRPSINATLRNAKVGMYVADCLINTEAQPAYLRLPSMAEYFPYAISYLFGFPPNTTRNALVGMQVFSSVGTAKVTATGNPTAVTVGFTSFPVSVPITLTTKADGFASVMVQRNGLVGFDWFSVDVF